MVRRAFTVALAAALLACGGGLEPQATGAGSRGIAGVPGEAIDFSVPPAANLRFEADWTDSLSLELPRGELVRTVATSNVLFAGSRVSLFLAASRLPDCGPRGEVFAGSRLPSGSTLRAVLAPVEGGWEGAFEIPAGEPAGELSLWFGADDGQGCVEWDSRSGADYRRPLHRWAPAIARFAADWTESLEGRIEKGGVVLLDYDWHRLSACTYEWPNSGFWWITAYARFGSGAVIEVPVKGTVALLPVPLDADRLEIWFRNARAFDACEAWDSDYGRNYVFPVQ